MYDISQLNDLLVPELHDIAEQLNISNAKKLAKPDLINKILETQTNMNTEQKPEGEKPKRKRIAKPATEAEGAPEPVAAAKPKKAEAEKKPVKKQVEVEEDDTDVQPITDQESTIDRKSTRLNSSHHRLSRMPSSA